MSTQKKHSIIQNLEADLNQAEAVVITNYRSLHTTQLQDLRKNLPPQEAKYKVVKNSLLKLAAKSNQNITKLLETLSGPTAVLFCSEKVIESLKQLVKFAKKHPQLEIKSAFFEGQIFDLAGVLELAKIPSKEELHTRLARALKSNQSRLVSALSYPYSSLVIVLNNVKPKER